jgi:hypothetical protein
MLFFSVFLLSLNIYNIFYPKDYRNDPHLINGYLSKENRNEILKYKDAIKKFDKLYSIHGESLKFLNEATKVYFISKIPTEYSWKEKYTKVKFQENWVLYFFRKFEETLINNNQKSKYNGAYIYYQSSDYKFALKRGISICSQDAVSFANLLKRRYNIDYNIVGLDGHVVMQAKVNNKYYLSDPNMGLTFNFNIDEYYNNDENYLKIKDAYTGIGRPDLINSFDEPGNRKFKYTGPASKENTYNPDTITIFSNYVKWLIPTFLFIIGFYLSYKKRKK